jgi:membrane protein required for colicin V production
MLFLLSFPKGVCVAFSVCILCIIRKTDRMSFPNPQTFNAFDWLLLAVLLCSTVVAFLRGIIRVLFSFIGLFSGIVLASWYYPNLAHRLAALLPTRAASELAAFLLIAISTMVLIGLLGRLVSRTARAVGLGIPDRLLGALFGFARGCLLGVAVIMAVAAFMPGSLWIAKSRLLPYFLDGAHAVSFVVPQDLQHRILRGAEALKHKAPDWIKPSPAPHNGTSLHRTAAPITPRP